MDDSPQVPFELMDDAIKDRFYRSGFTREEVDYLSHARNKDGTPKFNLDFDSVEFDNMLIARYTIMYDFFQMGYSPKDYIEYVEGLYITKALKSPFDLLSAESAPKRSDLSVGEYNRRLKRRNQVRSRLPSYFGSQEVQEYD